MLIGIFKSPISFQQEHFGIIFSQNLSHTGIEQQKGDGVVSSQFHTAINFWILLYVSKKYEEYRDNDYQIE